MTNLSRSQNLTGTAGCAHTNLIRYTVYDTSGPRALIHFRDYAECECGMHRASNLKRVSRQRGRKYPTTREQALTGPLANVVTR